MSPRCSVGRMSSSARIGVSSSSCCPVTKTGGSTPARWSARMTGISLMASGLVPIKTPMLGIRAPQEEGGLSVARAWGRAASGLLNAAEAVSRLDEAVGGPGLGGRVAGVRDDLEVGLGPAAMELPRRDHRADDVVPPLDDHGGDVANPFHVLEELVRVPEEGGVDEVVALDPGEGLGELLTPEALDQRRVGAELAGPRLPHAPGPRRLGTDGGVGAGQAPIVRAYEVVALLGRDG